MKKVLSVLLTLVLCLTFFAGCGDNQEEGGQSAEGATYELNLGTQFYDPASSTELNPQGKALQYFADQVEEKSEGRIKININWGSILGTTVDMAEMVKIGDLDLFAGGVTGALDPDFTVFMIPGVMDDLDMAKDLYANPDGELFQVMKRLYANNNMELLSADFGEFRDFMNNKHEVVYPEDCSDLLMRIYADDVVQTYWGGIANPTVMAMSEVYTGLQLGTIDGLEFCPPSTVANGFVDVLSYYTDVRWQWQDSNDISINAELFNSMSEEDQQILTECAWASSNYACEMLNEDYDKALDIFEENGIQLHFLTDEERAVWQEYSDSLQDTFKSFVDAELYEEVMNISNEYRANR